MDEFDEQLLERILSREMEDAGPKADHGALSYKGVSIDSRWRVLTSFDKLRLVVDEMPDLVRARVLELRYDENHGAFVVRPKTGMLSPHLPGSIEAAIMSAIRAHNGIIVEADDLDDDIFIDCNSGEDPDDYVIESI